MPNLAGTTSQRIRIGLTGLAFAFLLVLLGSAILRSGGDPAPPTAAEREAAAEPNEPLAELGVAPGATTSQTPANNSTSK
jgi:hypothetical protein